MRHLRVAVVLLAAHAAAGAVAASDTETTADASDPVVSNLRQALRQGLLEIDLRYRLEFVDSASFEKDALASTCLLYTSPSPRDNDCYLVFRLLL